MLPTATVGVVETMAKSVELLLVSCGRPPAPTLRTKLYCEVLPLAAARLVPSRRVSQLVPVLPPNPTASSRVAAVKAVAELNRPTLASFSMSEVKV